MAATSTGAGASVAFKFTATTLNELAGWFIGQKVRGRAGSYIITKQLSPCVWVANNEAEENVIIKSVRHWRLRNERDALRRFQGQTLNIRPMIDEIKSPADPPAIVLRYLDDDMLRVSHRKRLQRSELKAVAKGVLEALKVMHSEGYVHADVKPDNILVNHGTGVTGFQDIQLADFGGTVHESSEIAMEGSLAGTSLWRSPEVILESPWGTSADIWSFGATLISLILGKGVHIFDPGLPRDHPEYDAHTLSRHYAHFGPWPERYNDMFDQQTIDVLMHLADLWPKLPLFNTAEEKDISKEDKDFVLKIMQIDSRDRPTAEQLLADAWFSEPIGCKYAIAS